MLKQILDIHNNKTSSRFWAIWRSSKPCTVCALNSLQKTENTYYETLNHSCIVLQTQYQWLRQSMPLMAAKSFHSAAYRKQTLEEKWKRVGFQCVISQLMHGGDLSTCPSRNITKSGSIYIVNPAHLNINVSLPIMQSMLSTIFT